jgi:PDZ domain-containing protein
MEVARLSLIAALALGCAPGHTPVDVSQAPTPLVSTVFQLDDGHILIPAWTDADTAWLILDTGARYTILDAAAASRLGGKSIHGGSLGERAFMERLHLPGFELRHYQVDVGSFQSFSEVKGRRIDGALGSDVLDRFVVEIDYVAHTLRLFDRTIYHHSGSGIVVPFTTDRWGRPIVHAVLVVPPKRRIHARLGLDTGGSRLCLLLNTPFVARAELDPVAGRRIDTPLGSSLGGWLWGALARLDQVRVARFVVDSPTAGLGRHLEDFLADSEPDGWIGNRTLFGTKTIIDYAHHRIIIEPQGTAPRACVADASGLELEMSSDFRQVLVFHVMDHTPAWDADVHPGDEILAVDGRPTGERSLAEIRTELRGAGTTSVLLLRRGSDTVHATLHLRSVF